jgi:hypothetical protein
MLRLATLAPYDPIDAICGPYKRNKRKPGPGYRGVLGADLLLFHTSTISRCGREKS